MITCLRSDDNKQAHRGKSDGMPELMKNFTTLKYRNIATEVGIVKSHLFVCSMLVRSYSEDKSLFRQFCATF